MGNIQHTNNPTFKSMFGKQNENDSLTDAQLNQKIKNMTQELIYLDRRRAIMLTEYNEVTQAIFNMNGELESLKRHRQYRRHPVAINEILDLGSPS